MRYTGYLVINMLSYYEKVFIVRYAWGKYTVQYSIKENPKENFWIQESVDGKLNYYIALLIENFWNGIFFLDILTKPKACITHSSEI